METKRYWPILVSNSPIVAVDVTENYGLTTKFDIAIPDLDLSVDVVEVLSRRKELGQYILMMFDDNQLIEEQMRRNIK